jgi:hypothetical protein
MNRAEYNYPLNDIINKLFVGGGVVTPLHKFNGELFRKISVEEEDVWKKSDPAIKVLNLSFVL